jgi:hypothetical protein
MHCSTIQVCERFEGDGSGRSRRRHWGSESGSVGGAGDAGGVECQVAVPLSADTWGHLAQNSKEARHGMLVLRLGPNTLGARDLSGPAL